MNQKEILQQYSTDNMLHDNNNTECTERIMDLFRSIQRNFREQVFEKIQQYGFTIPQILLLFELHHTPNINLNELSERLGLSKSTVSGIVDRLETQGVVIRQIPKENRRVVNLSISQEFLNKCDVLELKSKYFDSILKSASQEDLKIIITGLEKLDKLIKENREECKKI